MAELLGGSAAKLNRADLSNVKNLIFHLMRLSVPTHYETCWQ